MATYFARKAGNINATDVWATTPSGTASDLFPSFTSGDVLMANSFTITVNVNTDLGSTGQVRNDTTGGATAGGGFTLGNGVTLTANVFGGSVSSVVCVTFSGATPNTATVIGNCTGGSINGAVAVANTSTGTLNINGLCTGGSGNSNANGASNGAGTMIITGNCTGGSAPNCHGASNGAGTMSITGNCFGSAGISCHGANNSLGGTLTITGNCTAGPSGGSSASHGANNASTGTLTIVGPVSQGGNANVSGSSATGAFGAMNASTGVMHITGPIYASEFDGGVGSANRSGLNFLTGPFYTSNTWGVNPNRCVSWRWATNLVNTTFIEVPTANLAAKRNLVTPDNATNFPAPSNVRSGVTFGIGGALVGTCAVPLPAQVAPGVPVSDTIGTLTTPTANEIRDAVWQAATSSLTTAGSIGERLKNAATVATTGEQLATALTAP